MVLFAVEASASSSGRPCGVYMFSGLTTLVFNIYNITPIFHQKTRLRWVANANEIDTNNMKSTWPTQIQPSRSQRKLYSIRSRWGSRWVGDASRWVGDALRWVGDASRWVREGFRYQHDGVWGLSQREIPTRRGSRCN